MKKIYFVAIICLFLSVPGLASATVRSNPIADNLKGRILLQTEEHGEAWYVDPVSGKRAYLGRPAQALQVMSAYGLGVSNENLGKMSGTAPVSLRGRILLQVEDKGQGYYVDPENSSLNSLGSPLSAWNLMRSKGLGISNKDIQAIPIEEPVVSGSDSSQTAAAQETLGVAAMERTVLDLVNTYRVSKGLPRLVWNERVAETARKHSADMAAGTVAFGHEGFEGRFIELRGDISITAMAENVAMNYGYSDPAGQAVSGWISSPGHEENIVGDYNGSGVGIVKTAEDRYYFTQLFVR